MNPQNHPTAGVATHNAGIAMQGRDCPRAEHIINGYNRNGQELSLMIERATALRDKIDGGKPSPDTKAGANQAPRAIPNGFIAMLEDHNDIIASKLSILSSILNDIERNF